MKFHLGAAALALALLAPRASAGDLTESIAQTMDNLDKQIEEARVWKFGVRPRFSQSIIWTDNVYLNDRGERPIRLIGATGPNGFVTDPKKLRQIQRGLSDFNDVESVGRVDDFISRTQLGADLVLPVNPEYTKIFKANEIKVFSADLRHHEYFDENDLDSTDFTLSSDVFGFLSDIIDFERGNRFWVRAGGDYSRLEEPLDTNIVELQQIGIASVNFRSFERNELELRAAAGYRHNLLDASLGSEYFRRRLTDSELRQAEYERKNIHGEVGYELPWFQEKRAFVRADFDQFEPGDRAVSGSDQALNDGDRFRIVAGVEGAFLSKKLMGRVAAGYEAWDSDVNTGLSGDTNDFNSMVGEVELAYRPWEERNTQFQFTYERTTEASAISNFNSIHRGTISASHEIVPRKWDADLSFGFTRTEASEGPRSKLYDVGMGITYHWLKQVEVSLRYTYSYSDSWKEISIISSFSRGGRDYIYVSESNGDFFVNTIALAVDVRF